MSRYNIWTPEQDTILHEMVPQGCSSREMAARIGVTRGSVQGRMVRLGLKLDLAHVHARYREGLAKRVLPPRPKGIRPSPENLAKRRATMKAFHALPENRDKMLARVAKMNAARDPKAIAAKASATKMAWCPEYLRDDARMMIRKAMRSGPTREIIGDMFHRDLQRALRGIAEVASNIAVEQRRQYRSFEAELERARLNGIRQVVPMVRADYAFSLTGGSLA